VVDGFRGARGRVRMTVEPTAEGGAVLSLGATY
jgi:hypothetical protein